MAVSTAGRSPGLYQVCTNANEDYVIAVPEDARKVLIWFETSASNATRVGGRATISGSGSKIASVANTDAKMGYYPDQPVMLDVPRSAEQDNSGVLTVITHLHVACPTALAVVRGTWFWNR
jgi:hypothetical protein